MRKTNPWLRIESSSVYGRFLVAQRCMICQGEITNKATILRSVLYLLVFYWVQF